MVTKIKLLVFILFGLFPFSLFSEHYEPVFNLHNINSGLSSNVIYDFAQDRQGYIWIATSNGLCRYDGKSTKIYSHLSSDSNSITNPIIYYLVIDSFDNIWMGNKHGVCIFDKQKNKFRRLKTSNSNLYSNSVSALSEIDGFIWISTSMGINYAKVSPDIDKIQINKAFEHKKDPDLPSPSKVFKTSGKQLIYHHLGIQRFFFDSKLNKPVKLDTFATNLNYAWIFEMLPNDQFLIYLASSGLYCQYQNTLKKVNVKGDIDIASIKKIKLLNGNKLAFATENGIFISNGIDLDNLELFRLSSKTFKDFNISALDCRTVFQSRDNTIWIGSNSNGIVYCNPENIRFQNLIIPNGTNKSEVTQNRIRAVAEDVNGNVLLGTSDVKIVVYNPNKNQYTYLDPLLEKNKIKVIGQIFSFTKKDENSFYVSLFGDGGGIAELNCTNNNYRITKFIPNNYILAITLSKNDNYLWVSCKGLFKVNVNSKEKEFTNIYTIIEHKKEDEYESVRAIKYLSDSILMVGTFSGLYLYYMDRNDMPYKYSRFVNNPTNKYSISSDMIRDFAITNDKRVFVATDLGINELIIAGDSVEFYNSNNTPGIPSEKTMAAISDNYNNLWINTLNGLVKYNYVEHNSNLYNIYDGLTANELHEHSQCKTIDGKMIVGTSFGANLFDPQKLEPLQQNAVPVIYNLNINNKNVEVNQLVNNRIILKKDIAFTDTIVLTRNDKTVIFTFSALYYISQQKVAIKYKLDGFDNEFITANPNENKATYTNLKGGDYKFIVMAANNDGKWNNTPKILHIKVIPYLYERIWFQILCLAFLITIIVIFFIKRINRIEKEKHIIEKLVEERTKELYLSNLNLSETNSRLEERQQFIEEQDELIRSKNIKLEDAINTKDRLFSIVAHDLKNPVGTLYGYSDMLHYKYESYNEEKRRKFIKNINSLSFELKSLIDNILQWSRSQLKALKVDKMEYSLYEQVNKLVSFYENQANAKGIIIINSIEINEVVNADYNIIDTILRNLISNAIKYTENGTISISFDPKKNIVRVADTGKGMTSEKLKTLFTTSNKSELGTKGEVGTGLGMSICKDFITLHGGEIWVDSSLGVGTTISISI